MLLIGAVSLSSISIAVGVAAAVIAAIVSVPEYLSKAKAQRATTDVQLARLFAELVPFATGTTTSSVLSDAVVTKLLERSDPPSVQEIAEQAAIPVDPMCLPTQAAALMSIAVLGRDYNALREPAAVALATAGPFEEQQDLERVLRKARALLVKEDPKMDQLMMSVQGEKAQIGADAVEALAPIRGHRVS